MSSIHITSPAHSLALVAASELDKTTLDKLKKSIESSKIAKEYKSLNVHNRVQSDLLGGFVVSFGDDKTVDLSVKSRVQRLEGLINRNITIVHYVIELIADCCDCRITLSALLVTVCKRRAFGCPAGTYM